MLSACSTLPLVVRNPEATGKAGGNRVYVANHGWHTGFIIPMAAIQKSVPEFGRRFGDAGYIEIGWGDRGFYQAEKITAGLAVRALFWPTESVVHAVAIPTDPVEYFPTSEVGELSMGDAELTSLVQFISGSLYRDDGGKIVPLGKGLYGDSQFYRGTGEYHLLNNCNKWTAKGLKSSGIHVSPMFKMSAGSVMDCIGHR